MPAIDDANNNPTGFAVGACRGDKTFIIPPKRLRLDEIDAVLDLVDRTLGRFIFKNG